MNRRSFVKCAVLLSFTPPVTLSANPKVLDYSFADNQVKRTSSPFLQMVREGKMKPCKMSEEQTEFYKRFL